MPENGIMANGCVDVHRGVVSDRCKRTDENERADDRASTYSRGLRDERRRMDDSAHGHACRRRLTENLQPRCGIPDANDGEFLLGVLNRAEGLVEPGSLSSDARDIIQPGSPLRDHIAHDGKPLRWPTDKTSRAVTFDQVGRDFDRKRAAAKQHVRPSNTQENFPQNDKQQV
jgi:hypothetical protein